MNFRIRRGERERKTWRKYTKVPFLAPFFLAFIFLVLMLHFSQKTRREKESVMVKKKENI